jgi:hypothetical protein
MVIYLGIDDWLEIERTTENKNAIENLERSAILDGPFEGAPEDNSKLTEQVSTRKRGLGSASAETRERVARAGGTAFHQKRGLQASDSFTRRSVARRGGLGKAKQRRRTVQEKAVDIEDNQAFDDFYKSVSW